MGHVSMSNYCDSNVSEMTKLFSDKGGGVCSTSIVYFAKNFNLGLF